MRKSPARRPAYAAVALAAAATAGAACSQIIGADKNREPAQREVRPDLTAKTEMVTPTKTCKADEKLCAGACVKKDNSAFGCSADTCERCSLPFTSVTKCVNEACAVGVCAAGRGNCDGRADNGCEADTTEGATCGSCDNPCSAATPLCAIVGTPAKYTCVATCPPNLTECGSSCADLNTAPAHCGSCTTACPVRPNASPSCAQAKCSITCNGGFGDCNANPTDGCEPLKPYFADKDHDGFGAGPVIGEACTAPDGGALVATDCLDSNPNVRPNQVGFFATGYTAANGSLSYDYDCNGVEVGEPGRPTATCSPCKAGVGQQFPSRPNPFCGSTVALSCGSTGCVTDKGAPYACR